MMSEQSLGEARAGFRQALGAEWTKFRSTRSAVWTVLTAAVMIPVLSVIVAATGSIQPDDTILGGSLTGAVPAQMVLAAFGALIVTSEYRTGLIRTTFAAVPRRATVVLAKAGVVAGVVFVAALAAVSVGFAVGLAMLEGQAYARGEPFPALVGIALTLATSGVLGVAIGSVLRHSAGAVAAVVGLMLLPTFLAPLLGDHQRWLGGASPTAVLQKLMQTSDATERAVGSLPAGPSLIGFAGCTALMIGGAIWFTRRRDV